MFGLQKLSEGDPPPQTPTPCLLVANPACFPTFFSFSLLPRAHRKLSAKKNPPLSEGGLSPHLTAFSQHGA